ncbi:uncharacterized protein RHO25_011127 [Cercospora beticola]|nr:hypothetical protein RHO25_011127 [Cercospora beticola]CAK1366375.1 unnamed protein product [Cercospora beticola]
MPPPDYTGDAASRVFAVPELLEHILFLAVTTQRIENPDYDEPGPLKMWPMAGCAIVSEGCVCLFQIQRVSRAFRHTIHGSVKLKRLMFLAPQENSKLLSDRSEPEPGMELHQPLTSLLSMMCLTEIEEAMVIEEVDITDGNYTWHAFIYSELLSVSETPYDRALGELPKGWRNPEASWKKIRICNAKVPCALNFRVEGEFQEDDEAPPFNITFRFEEDDTLDHAFNLLEGLLTVLSKYRDKKIAMDNDQRAEEDLLHDTPQSEQSSQKAMTAMEKRHDKKRLQLERAFDRALKRRTAKIQESKSSH